ncbi:MAG TPA: hypothetical protein DDW20_05895 [Firmicutes bacterium]|nr:hypothetical protein [Bacillota bacterium]
MKKNKNKKGSKLWAEFKAFISRGNVLDLAVGVVIGGAFSAIVNAVVKMLISVCTWGVPGGITGLITILPAINESQKGYEGIGLNATYSAHDFLALEDYAKYKDMYVTYGSTYVYKGLAVIDWGTLINAVISFLIIAIVLFTIIKVTNTLKQKKAEMDAKLLEDYYKKHPEERPAPVVPGKPAPTEAELLTQIRDLLKEQQAKKQ